MCFITIGVLIVLDCIFNLKNHEMKIKTTFLNDVQKKIYINKPKDFTELGKENKV